MHDATTLADRQCDTKPRDHAAVPPIAIAPDDVHNRALIGHVHPGDWVNPDPPSRYNLVVIGAGTAGLVTAAGAAGLGARVALIEKHLMGGDCLNVGCVPSKALIRAARAVADVRDAGQFGVQVPAGSRVDFPALMQRMRRLRAEISPNDSVARFRDLGVDVYLGAARFSGKDTVEVAGKKLRFKKAVIATGARAAQLPIPGLDETGFLTNETVFSLTELPGRLAVIGAGPIGCELSQAFARFGSHVVLLEAGPGILPREDRDAAERLQRAMIRDSVRIVTTCKLVKTERQGDEKVLHWQGPDGSEQLAVDEILVGAGRAPNVDGLGLETAGVQFDRRKGVQVTDRLQTTNPSIYAAGDVCSQWKFTHAADFMARIAIRNALFRGRAKASTLTIPWCTYTSPEIAHVGLYEHQAREQSVAVETFTQELANVDRAILDGQTDGFVKIHVRQGTDKIVGATVVANHAGDLISELTVAIDAGLGLGKLANVIHPYPTQAEAILRVGDAYNRTRLTPRVKWLFSKWLSWTG